MASKPYAPPPPGTRAAKYLMVEEEKLCEHPMAKACIRELELIESDSKNVDYIIFVMTKILEGDALPEDSRHELFNDLTADLLGDEAVLAEKKLFYILRNVLLMVGAEVRSGKGNPIVNAVLDTIFPAGTEANAQITARQKALSERPQRGDISASENALSHDESTQNANGSPETGTAQMKRPLTRQQSALDSGIQDSAPHPVTLSNPEDIVTAIETPEKRNHRKPKRQTLPEPPTTRQSPDDIEPSSCGSDPGDATYIPKAEHNNIDNVSRDETKESRTPTYDLAGNKSRVALMVKGKYFTGAPDCGTDFYTMSKTFEAACLQQGLPLDEATDVLWHCLDGDAKRFYFEHIQGKKMTLSEAFNLLQDQFDTLHHQSQAQSYINSITMRSIRSEKGCNDIEALRIVHERLSETLPKCGNICRSDEYKILTLERIVKYEAWAANVITTRSANPDLKYSSFYTMLCTAANLHVEKSNISSNSEDLISEENKQISAIPLHYGSTYGVYDSHKHGKRGGNPRPTFHRSGNRPENRRHNSHRSNKHTPEQLAARKSRTRCHYCGELGHWREECKKRDRTLADVVRARLSEKAGTPPLTAFAEILGEIVQHEDEYNEYVTTFMPEPNDEHDCSENGHMELMNSVLFSNEEAQSCATDIFNQISEDIGNDRLFQDGGA